MSAPKVSVAMVTYNHEPFIAQAIESVLAQQADFACELVIGEDCSTDRTRDICEHYAREFPGIVRLLPSERNLGVQANAIRTLNACDGEYIAVLDGDDYWTSSAKLQRQVRLMDQHPEHAVSFHDVLVVPEDPAEESWIWPGNRIATITTAEDLLNEYFMFSCSIVMRRADVIPVPSWLVPTFGDFSLVVLAAQRGTIHHMSTPMSVYRLHSTGFWTSQSAERKRTAVRDCLLAIAANLPDLRAVALKRVDRADFDTARGLQEAGDLPAARKQLASAIPRVIRHRAVPTRDLVQLAMYAYLPGVARVQLALRRFAWARLRGR